MFLVKWEMDIDAETPVEAARKAWESMREENSTASVFDVADAAGDVVHIDLHAITVEDNPDVGEVPTYDFTINVAMDVRAYGYVTINASTLDEAVGKCTPQFVRDNFEPHGSGEDDLDCSHPSGIYLDGATWWTAGNQPFEEQIETDLDDDAKVSPVTGLLFSEALILIETLDSVSDLSDPAKQIRARLEQYVATRTM